MPDLNAAFNNIRNMDKQDGETRTWGEWFDNVLRGANHPYKKNNGKITQSDWNKFVETHASLNVDGKKYLTESDASKLFKDAAGGSFGKDVSGFNIVDPTLKDDQFNQSSIMASFKDIVELGVMRRTYRLLSINDAQNFFTDGRFSDMDSNDKAAVSINFDKYKIFIFKLVTGDYGISG